MNDYDRDSESFRQPLRQRFHTVQRIVITIILLLFCVLASLLVRRQSAMSTLTGPITVQQASEPTAGASATGSSLGVVPTFTSTPQATAIPPATSTPTPSALPAATLAAAPAPRHLNQWRAEYWNSSTLSGAPLFTRYDPMISCDWGDGSPHNSLNGDHFSVRWMQTLSFETGVYRFFVEVDDGALVLDAWQIGSARGLRRNAAYGRQAHSSTGLF